MKRTFAYQITPADVGLTIEQFLKEQGFSSQNLTYLKKQDQSILVNGREKRVIHTLKPLDLLLVRLVEGEASSSIAPVSAPLDIVYEDEDILVVNKPADMPTHPSMGNHENTLANAVGYYYSRQGIPFTFRCINRLDRNTTGLTIIAKHMVSAGILSRMITEHQIHREYLAIVKDRLLPDLGIVNAPIGRKEGSIIERKVDFIDGCHAVTRYEVLSRENGYALVSLVLDTGRTHQIRVHMKYLKCPLVGDTLYNPDPVPDKNADILKRQALHACRITLPHPVTGKPLCFTQGLPGDMTEFLKHTMSFTYEEYR